MSKVSENGRNVFFVKINPISVLIEQRQLTTTISLTSDELHTILRDQIRPSNLELPTSVRPTHQKLIYALVMKFIL